MFSVIPVFCGPAWFRPNDPIAEWAISLGDCKGVSDAPKRMLQCTFGTFNVRRKMDEDFCAHGGLRTKGGFCEHVREQLESRGVHIIGIQEAHSPSGCTILSDSHIRIAFGPHAPNKRGDV